MPKSVGPLLGGVGGLLLAVSVALPMADVFGPKSPWSAAGYVVDQLRDGVRDREVAEAWGSSTFLLLLLLPHLLGLLVLLGVLFRIPSRPRVLRVARSASRILFVVWIVAYAVHPWERVSDPLVWAVPSVVVILLGLPWTPRRSRAWTDARFVRRSLMLGAVVALIWFGTWLVDLGPDGILLGLPLAMLAAVAILVGALVESRASRA